MKIGVESKLVDFRPGTPQSKLIQDTIPVSQQAETPPPDVMDVCSATSEAEPLEKAIWTSPQDFYDGDEAISDPESGNGPRSPSITLESMANLEKEVVSRILFEKWLGSCVLRHPDWMEENSDGKLKELITQRAAAEAAIRRNPYDPEYLLRLANIYFDLCYSDLQVSTAHRALILIDQSLIPDGGLLGRQVRAAVAKRLCCYSIIVVEDELVFHRLEAFKALLRGLIDAGAYRDGIKEAKKVLRIYPDDEHLLLLQKMLKEYHGLRMGVLRKSKTSPDMIKYLGRIGRTQKRRYPWLADDLFFRTPDLLTEINTNLNSTNCEVRQVQFGNTPLLVDHVKDVGPLGIFAKRDIRKDEVVLIDHGVTLVPNTPSSTTDHCEACQASLSPHFLPKSDIRIARCCGKVAYCSDKCHDEAVNGYHRVLCGKDFSWLYKDIGLDGEDGTWRHLIILRLLAVIVADTHSKPEIRKMHPLQHPLMARLTAGYSVSPSRDPIEHEWSYFIHVIAPTKILLMLGVDIFSSPEWTPEVLHTILWREANNSCRSTSIADKDGKWAPNALSGISLNYVFFNHSCDANINWMAAGGGEGVTILGRTDQKTRVGCSSMLCIATKDIKAGEEARISYVPHGSRKQLSRWFEGGCGCGACADEAVPS